MGTVAFLHNSKAGRLEKESHSPNNTKVAAETGDTPQ